MRVFSWLAAAALVVTIGLGLSAVVNRDTASGRSLTASTHPAASAGSFTSYDYEIAPHRIVPRPSPIPSPTPPPAPPPAAHPAAPAAAPVHHAAPPPPPPPAVVVRTTQQALINQDRARYGLPPLTWSSCLDNVAVSNAQRMAAQGFISHTNGPSADLSCGLGHQAGENVGDWSAGINDAQLNTMFMNSPEHRANILGPYHYVATAWVVSNGYGYIAVEFS
jgi:uncharacterized protein YkwD